MPINTKGFWDRPGHMNHLWLVPLFLQIAVGEKSLHVLLPLRVQRQNQQGIVPLPKFGRPGIATK